MVTEIHSKVLQ